jgi:hypothetical protein
MTGVQRGVFALVGLFKFHSVSLCGRLYPLPRRTTFRFRNALHLIEARNSVAYVRGIFQRLLALLGESELGCGYPQDAASAEQLRKRSFVQDSAASIPGQCCSAVSLLDGNTGASPVLTRLVGCETGLLVIESSGGSLSKNRLYTHWSGRTRPLSGSK